MVDAKREAQVCGVVVRLMERRKADELVGCHPHDKAERNQQAVEYLLEFNSGDKFAMEHTRLGSFPQQIADNVQWEKLLLPLEAELSGTLALPGHYILAVEAGATAAIRRYDAAEVRAGIARWVREVAAGLQVGSPATTPEHIARAKPVGVPFVVVLARWPSMDGKFSVLRHAMEDLDDLRRERVRRALDDKCPKLLQCAADGRKSVLVFEFSDIALGYEDAHEAIAEELREMGSDAPDEVYFVLAPDGSDVWYVWILKEGARIFPYVDDGKGIHVSSSDCVELDGTDATA